MSKHSLVHIEFSANDLKAAEKFFSDVFGWKVQQMPEMNYAMYETGEGVGGGFNPVSDTNLAGTILPHIGTNDVNATLADIESHGGKTLVPKTEIPGMGWFAIFSDPTGNQIGLYEAADQ